MRHEIFDKWISGRTCLSCAIIREDSLSFILGWSLTEDIEASEVAQYYFVHYLPDEQGVARKEDFGVELLDDTSRRLAVSRSERNVLGVGLGGSTLFQTAQCGGGERLLTRREIRGVRDVRFIGDHFYVAGGIRSVLRRDDIDQWTVLTPDLQVHAPTEPVLSLGFDSVDGFGESDLYAVGGHGDAWRYDGTQWLQIDLPTKTPIKSVCCASDGFVYIGGRDHLVLRGREDRWEVHHRDESNRWFKQIVDFKGRKFTLDEWGNDLFEITETGVRRVDTGDIRLSCHCMATGHGRLLVAGSQAAFLFDGVSWRSVFQLR